MSWPVQLQVEGQSSTKRERASSPQAQAKKVKSAEELRKVAKHTHGQSSDLGGVAKHTTVDSKTSSPLRVSLAEWGDGVGEESELQESARSLE